MSNDNRLGLLGLSTLTLGAATFLVPARILPWWAEWVLAPLLWYVGAGMVFAFVVARLSSAPRPHDAAHANEKKT
jgi:hypothetical protein